MNTAQEKRILSMLNSVHDQIMMQCREWITEGWGCVVEPTFPMYAAALLNEAKTQDVCVKQGQSDPAYPNTLRQIAMYLLQQDGHLPQFTIEVDEDIKWTSEMREEAFLEGWNLFPDEEDLIEICKFDDPHTYYEDPKVADKVPQFSCDEDALNFVFNQAVKGDKKAIVALYMCGKPNNPRHEDDLESEH